MKINGFVEPGWESVEEAFQANFENGAELGASAYVTHRGEPVVDLWAGDADSEGRPWESDTIINVYSTTKTMTAICVMLLVERGLVDLDEPVAAYWPEFAANGKEAVTVRQLMCHSSGLSGFAETMTPEDLYDWDKCVGVLAAQAPWWEPGTASGYHAITQGYLLGEVVRRVDGRTLGNFFRQEVAEPLDADFHIGFGPELDHRCAELIAPSTTLTGESEKGDGSSLSRRTFASHHITGHEPNTREWRQAEIPAAGGFGNARSVGKIHSALVDACAGRTRNPLGQLLKPETIEEMGTEQISGKDLVLGSPMTFGLTFGLPSETIPLPNPRSMFWGGWGGSMTVVDLEAEITVAYAMNKMAAALMGDSRGGAITIAAYMALLAQAE